MGKQASITTREWALFGLRWMIPLGLLSPFLNSPIAEGNLRTTMIVASIAAVSNLVVLLLLLYGRWSPPLTIFIIGIDVILTIASVIVGGMPLGWIGLIAAMTAGVYFGWEAGLGLGVAVIVGILVSGFMKLTPQVLDTASLALLLMALLVSGPLMALLSHNTVEVVELRGQLQNRGKRAEQVARMATEYMRVVYEMTEILSASKLDPKRVLASAVGFAVDALERVGIDPPLYSAILLFADEGGTGSVLKIARSSASVLPSDTRLAVPGVAGVVANALERQAPMLCHDPAADPELHDFESFGKCNTVLCLPLRSGNESYGVMLVGTGEEDALREMHVELMRAVANQAASSLNNARLFGALLEQRDRLVGIEKAARAQLASELHDGPTQGVAAITMRLNYIRRLIEKKPEAAVDELYKIEDLARRTTKEIRHMLFELRPVALDQGLTSGLQQLAVKMKETYEQNVEIAVDPQCDQLLDAQSTHTLFSIVAESVNNARKHAKAERIVVQMNVQQDALVLTIADNGVGFDVESALAAARDRAGHLGLINLQERAHLVEGLLTIQSEIGRGSRTTVTIPLEILELRKTEEATRKAENESGEGLSAHLNVNGY
ncbi:MAG: GAF domain-containing sensor histidine kinase [Anaerolineae bacterium]|nr:GAF domain-containing sensor histidine kinase [Anaerolineae bacterium]